MDAELAFIAEATGAKSVRRGERIQSLWSGYGEIVRVHLVGADVPSVVVKWVRPGASPRGTARDVGHTRKVRSYEVEATWYRTMAKRCDDACRVPRLVASHASNGERIFVLEDLDAAGFGERRRSPSPAELDRCLAWLAAFHATFLGQAPEGLWKVGTYWHLATRREELAAIDDDALREAAPILDRKLREGAFRTIVHGDAKLANFCFSRGGRSVAAVDFQYVGGGCGMQDVAYLLCGHYDDEAREAEHLDRYFTCLRERLRAKRSDGAEVPLDALEAEWRALYPIACADFYRFLAGWSKAHYSSDAYAQCITRNVLRSL